MAILDILLASPVKEGSMLCMPCRVVLAISEADDGYSNEYVTCVQDMDDGKFLLFHKYGDDLSDAITNYKARCANLELSTKVHTIARIAVA